MLRDPAARSNPSRVRPRPNWRYAPALKFKDDPDTFAREIHKAGYATAPNYAEKLIALMRQYNLYRFDR